MTRNNQSIRLYAGDAAEIEFIIERDGSLMDLSGWTVEYVLGPKSAPRLTKSTTDESIERVTEADLGTNDDPHNAVLILYGSETASLGGQSLPHRVHIHRPDDRDATEQTVAVGTAHIYP